MANKLSWNPPKWKSYTLDRDIFKVELETGEIFTGTLSSGYIVMDSHQETCYKIFGQAFTAGHTLELSELSRVLDLNLKFGNWPEYYDVVAFLDRYYERVAKIEESFTKSTISIESEFNITPKFTL